MKVWVLIIDHKHGTDASVHVSRPAANKALFDYCNEWWPHEFEGSKPPDDELVSEYWDHMSNRGEEWHCIEECEVVGDVSIPPVFIPTNANGVKPGYYTRRDIVELLRKHAEEPNAVYFIADMLE